MVLPPFFCQAYSLQFHPTGLPFFFSARASNAAFPFSPFRLGAPFRYGTLTPLIEFCLADYDHRPSIRVVSRSSKDNIFPSRPRPISLPFGCSSYRNPQFFVPISLASSPLLSFPFLTQMWHPDELFTSRPIPFLPPREPAPSWTIRSSCFVSFSLRNPARPHFADTSFASA